MTRQSWPLKWATRQQQSSGIIDNLIKQKQAERYWKIHQPALRGRKVVQFAPT